MKIRSIRPEFFSDVKMAQLSPFARLLYIGLWCSADDEGRGEYLPKKLEGEIFPHDTVDFEALWAELEQLDRVRRYAVGDRVYFYIPRWSQKPNRVYPSRFPAPPDEQDSDKTPPPPTNGANSADAVRAHRVSSAHAVTGEGAGEGVGVGEGDKRARGAEPEIEDEQLEDLLLAMAIEKARQKGAHNPEGLARVIYLEDREDLIAELADRRRREAEDALRQSCRRCDGTGWVDVDDTRYRCSHQEAEVL